MSRPPGVRAKACISAIDPGSCRRRPKRSRELPRDPVSVDVDAVAKSRSGATLRASLTTHHEGEESCDHDHRPFLPGNRRGTSRDHHIRGRRLAQAARASGHSGQRRLGGHSRRAPPADPAYRLHPPELDEDRSPVPRHVWNHPPRNGPAHRRSGRRCGGSHLRGRPGYAVANERPPTGTAALAAEEAPAPRHQPSAPSRSGRPCPKVGRAVLEAGCLDGLGYEVFNVANADMSVAATTQEIQPGTAGRSPLSAPVSYTHL